ncbi:ATP-grasp fold amidoligase family protein [Sphingomonas sp. Marseille-Q8236]
MDLTRTANHEVAAPPFERKFGREPLPPGHPDALINDVIYDRMIDPDWPRLARTFVDKQTAKAEARRVFPELRVPETRAVIPITAVRSPEHLFEMLRPFLGTDAIAKPTHASGGVTFLRDLTDPAELRPLYDLASVDYAPILREMQYWQLPRQIIVEAMIPTTVPGPPDDYKFHSIHGRPLLCQIDHGRFGEPWSRLFRVPDFEPMDEDDGLRSPSGFVRASRERLEAMTAAARALSVPFAFVRVDLYDGRDGIYFGELTFTPAASLGIAPSSQGVHRPTATHEIYSDTLMQALGAGRPAIKPDT